MLAVQVIQSKKAIRRINQGKRRKKEENAARHNGDYQEYVVAHTHFDIILEFGNSRTAACLHWNLNF